MEIINSPDYIRQQQLGQFRRPEDGKEPFARVNNQKLESKKERKDRSVYVNKEKAVTFNKKAGTYLPKFFDFDAGMKFNIEKISKTSKEEKLYPQYDESGKAQIITITKQERSIDQWV